MSRKVDLYGEVNFKSDGNISILYKNADFVQSTAGLATKLICNGDVVTCGNITGTNYLNISPGQIRNVDETTFEQLLKSYTVSFDINGGTLISGATSKTIYNGQKYGKLPTVERNNYLFQGWYTAATGGTKVTNTTVFNAATTIYVHWTPGDVSGWVKASEMPAGAQIVNTKWTYTLREYKESSSSSMSGYTKYDTKRTSWGGTQGPVYSDPSNGARNVWSEQYETGRTHHWVYYRWQNPANDYGSDVQSNSYKNYQEIDLTYQLTETGTMGVHSRGYKYWQGSSYDTYWPSREYDDVHYGTRWYYQDPVYTYYFYRDVNKEAASDPNSQANVSNVVKYVQYRASNCRSRKKHFSSDHSFW